MRFFLYHDQQITVYTPVTGSISFSAHRKLHSFSYPCRNIQCNNLIFL